jgi:hypothetical protein
MSKAYLDYEQRKRTSNPFPAGSLVKQTPTQLLSSPSDYPIRCRGVHGMASTDGKNLIVNFKKGDRPADQLLPGQCSWLDRGLRANEPTRIADGRPSADEARKAAKRINAGDTWTFWVVNDGTSFKATASAKGTPSQKPWHVPILRHRPRPKAPPASPSFRRALSKAALVQALRQKRAV